ncbi:MAG: ATP-binding protein [Deltaproteobacteria bacterium]|nr:ATP-binding protein [Deltaproteobacteria bacterium]
MNLTRSFQKILEKRLREESPLLQILLGPRQVGKTTAAEEIYKNWQGPKLLVSADHPTPPHAEWIAWQWEKAKSLGKGTLLIIDEVQKINGWSEQIKRLFDPERGKGNLKILLLGSSSLYLQRGLRESLVGRFELVTANHWSFSECQSFFHWNFEEYLRFGAYPGAAPFAKDEDRWKKYILNSVIEPVLSKDILGQHPVANPALFRQTFELAMHYPAQVVSFQKLLGQLQERGNASTIKHYLTLFEQAFLIRLLPKYSGSALQTKTSSPKIIPLNPALVLAYQTRKRLEDDPSWYGFFFEAIMGMHLLRQADTEVFYWKKGDAEVDYVLKKPEETIAIEIKSGRKKTTKGLHEFSKAYPQARCESWGFEECLRYLTQVE